MKPFICLLPLFWLAACASPPAQPETEPDIFAQALVAQPPQPLVTPTPPPELNNWTLSESAQAQTRFDVQARAIPAPVFFADLAAQAGVNAVVPEDVNQLISLSLKDVTLAQTLEALEDLYGLQTRRTSYGFRVVSQGLQTVMLTVDYPNLSRDGESSLQVDTGQLAGGQQASGVSTAVTSSVWPALEQGLNQIIGTGEGRELVVDRQSGVVMITAMADEIRRAEQLLTIIERRIATQVVIEARVLEVRLNSGARSGIDWQAVGDLSQGTASAQMSGSSVVDSALNGVVNLSLNTNYFDTVIELLETQGDVEVLSSPRIATLNNQKAVIKAGSDEFFVTGVTGTDDEGNANNFELTPFFSGVALDVTPQIADNGDVILHVRPTVAEVDERTKLIEVNSRDYRLPLASSQIRETDSIIRARNEQVVVIGGLLQTRNETQNAGLPWFQRLPVIGQLFRQQNQSQSQHDLVILLRPVVTDDQYWQQSVEALAPRFQ